MRLTGSKKIMGGLALAGTLLLTGVGLAQQPATQGQDDGERGGREWRHKGGKEGRGMRGGFGGRFAERLNLTDAQKEQMKQIAARYHESTKALRQQARAARRGGDTGFINGGAFDEAAVRAAAQTRANARVELEVARARMMSEMYALLTPEQKSQLATERQQWEQKRQERRARRGADSGQNQ
ncbi:MAG TPA: Spy/CpxP family protein refolding chaperone [Pyrinomonadaceae bacterium]|jgi:Spy/CpxP family protein refolding chaperone|nr:Spy/CpxP family protein refolding chaperone [Pyrinomonadaceae bacterium]